MNHPVDDVGRVLVRGRATGFEATALIDGHINDHCAVVHLAEHRPRHQLRRCGAGNQHRADHQISYVHILLHRVAGGVDRVQAPVEYRVQIIQARQGTVQNGDVRTHAHRHARGIDTHHAAADHHHIRRWHAGHTAHQHTQTTLRLLQRVGTGLNGHAPRYFAHRRKQWQASVTVGDRFIGDGNTARIYEALSLLRIRRQMQIGEQDLPGAQHLALHRLRLLDLDDHLRLGEHRLSIVSYTRAGGEVQVVGEADGLTRSALDQHLMAMLNQLSYTARRQANAIFVVLDFFGYTDEHAASPCHCDAHYFTCAYARGQEFPVSGAKSLMRNPTRLPALLVAVGLAFSAYYGDLLRKFEPRPEEQIRELIQIEVAKALVARGDHLRPEGDKLLALVAQIESEVRAEDRLAKRQIEKWLGIGLFVLVIGIGQYVFVLLAERMRHQE